MTTIAARPIKEKDRIASLDVLRGFAETYVPAATFPICAV